MDQFSCIVFRQDVSIFSDIVPLEERGPGNIFNVDLNDMLVKMNAEVLYVRTEGHVSVIQRKTAEFVP